MRENVIRSVELGVVLAACYMAAVTMVQTTLYDKIINMIKDSFMGPLLEPYMPYFNLAVMVLALALCFMLWRKGDIGSFSKLFSLNMLMFFFAVLDFSTFNWVGLILDLMPSPKVDDRWVFSVGLLLQVTYLLLRYTYRFREDRVELLNRGALEEDINQVSIKWGEAEMVQDPKGGRPRPVLQEDRMHEESYDSIISAIGQGSNLDFLTKETQEQLAIEWGKFTPGEYQHTPLQKVFVGGDVANRIADAISAIEDGHHAARGISTTRGSLRNSARYRRSAAAVGASGVPRLTSSTAVRSARPCSNGGSVAKLMGRHR